MNKTELTNKIAEDSGLSKADAKKALEATIDAIRTALQVGDKVAILGFGTFTVQGRSARKGLNPATGQTIHIPSKKVVKFKAGIDLSL